MNFEYLIVVNAKSIEVKDQDRDVGGGIWEKQERRITHMKR